MSLKSKRHSKALIKYGVVSFEYDDLPSKYKHLYTRDEFENCISLYSKKLHLYMTSPIPEDEITDREKMMTFKAFEYEFIKWCKVMES
jgi:hypothetical protein